MQQSRHLSVLLVCLAIPSAPALSQREPDDNPWIKGAYRVDPVSRALQPLDWTWSKKEDAGYSFFCYLPGLSASVAFAYGEPLVFAKAVRESRKPEDEKKQPSLTVERLALKKERRYATNQLVPLEATDSGEMVTLFASYDKKRKKPLPHRVFWYRPLERLAPGEYALAFGAMVSPYNGCSPTSGAFRISQDVPAAQRSAPVQQPAAPSAPQTLTAPRDMGQLRESAERGDRNAQYQLGSAYGRGEGVPQDYELAALWLRKAAVQGSRDAQHWLAIMYRDGLGMSKDDTQAARLFQQAAEQGLPLAQVYLAEYYALGKGVFQDYAEAHKWLNLAAARLHGDEQRQAAGFREQVAAKMTPAQIADAQKRAREWMEAFEKRRP